LGIYRATGPVVTVVDGIVGMEGDGPLFGDPIAHGLLAVGADPVAVDATCCRLMGISPTEVDHLMLADWAGIGQVSKIELRGDDPASLQRQYKRPPSS
jgi:uncharacterized protein (DUF362 family)